MVKHALAVLRRGFAVGAGVGLLVAVAGAPSAAAAAKVPGPTKVFGSVTYRWWPCNFTLARLGPPKFVPLAGATIDLRRPGVKGGMVEDLSPAGTFSVSIGGRGPIRARVLLYGPQVAVLHAAEEKRGGAYWLDLGVLKPGRNDVKIRDQEDAGAANIWMVMTKGAAVADKLSPVRPPKVWVYWQPQRDPNPPSADGGQGTSYRPGTHEIFVDGAPYHDEWWQKALLHEYGHHVLHTVADFRNPGGDHVLPGVYPMSPKLPWDEGFAQAFAAIVLDSPQLTDNFCEPDINLDATPATPLPQNPRLAQYNEVATAGALWKLAQYLGKGNAQAGFGKLLVALHEFKYDGHGPASLRQARDALIAGGLEHSSASEHSVIDSILADENIGWGEDVQVNLDDLRDEGLSANMKIHLALTGPYGTCQVTGNDINPPPQTLVGTQDQWYGDIGVQGGLPYTWQDECLVAGGNSDPSENQTIVNSLLWLKFPYLADEKHLGSDFTLTAQYVCSDNTQGMEPNDPNLPKYQCTPDRKVDVIVTPTVGDPIEEDGIDLQRGAPTKIQYFNATGNVCVLYPSYDDCRT